MLGITTLRICTTWPLLLQGDKSTGKYGICLEKNRNWTASLSKKSRKKLRKNGASPRKNSPADINVLSGAKNKDTSDDGDNFNKVATSDDTLGRDTCFHVPTRSDVLQACIITSGSILALGVILRGASHIAFAEGWIKQDNCSEISFGFEPWDLHLIIGLVVLISTCRYVLLRIWPDFQESSEAANGQVLTTLQPLDYVLVAFLPGISEELLFRGGLLPIVGLNWESALAIGVVFGGLHLGNGRKYSFAIWATFVGFAYGAITLGSSSIVVPMAAHSLNNLVGGILWNYSSKSRDGRSSQ